jgi:hypothetical protein
MMLSFDPANHSCRKLFRQSNEGQAGRRLGPEGSFFTSQALNICSAPIVRPLAHSTEYGDTRQQWLTPAFTVSEEREIVYQ